MTTMTATIPSLWPDDIRVDLVPPVAVLRAQAAKLGQITQGILDADVTTVTGEKDFVVHRLDLIAPALAGRRYRALTVTHRADYYPVVLEADCFRPKTRAAAFDDPYRAAFAVAGAEELTWPRPNDWRPTTADQDDFLKKVGEVLRSKEVRSVIESMIALSNQQTGKSEAGESTNGNPAA